MHTELMERKSKIPSPTQYDTPQKRKIEGSYVQKAPRYSFLDQVISHGNNTPAVRHTNMSLVRPRVPAYKISDTGKEVRKREGTDSPSPMTYDSHV